MKTPRNQITLGCSRKKTHIPHPLLEDLPSNVTDIDNTIGIDSFRHLTPEMVTPYQGSDISNKSGVKPRKVAKQSYVRSTHHVFSELTKRSYTLESELEVDYFNFLNFDRRQSYFDVQPQSIQYFLNGRKRRYTADFLVIFNNTTYIVEIKYTEETSSAEFKQKVKALTAHFAKGNQVFCVLTEQDIRLGDRASNLSYLQVALRQPAPIPSISLFLKTLTTRSLTVYEFQEALIASKLSPDLCRKAVAHKLLRGDLTKPWPEIVLSW